MTIRETLLRKVHISKDDDRKKALCGVEKRTPYAYILPFDELKRKLKTPCDNCFKAYGKKRDKVRK